MSLERAIGTRVVRTAAGRLARRLDLVVTGAAHVPARGPVVLAGRHVHHLWDGVAIVALVPRELRIMVALDWVRNRAARRLMETLTGVVGWPVVLRTDALEPGPDGHPRNTGGAYRRDEVQAHQLRAMRGGLAWLARGGALLVFPEAYPNVDPGYTPKTGLAAMLPFRHGFASLVRLARERHGVRVPVVPVGLDYRPGARWRVAVAFGEPLELDGRASSDAFVRAVEHRVARLSHAPDAARPLEASRVAN